jgi:hydrogenase expression/formation protein HypD
LPEEVALRKQVEALAKQIARVAKQPLQFMEVCGTHAHAVGRLGLRQLLPETLTLLSGPGCPVCVTPTGGWS